ncbi:MAG: replication-associated recombination protein A [Acidobacteria bacterium]|nr:replication-associated recombination protein A [Acidobacteriota bacterium]
MQKPFAEQFRPDSLDDFVGQEHLVGQGKPIRRFIEEKHVQSMIFWGPPGSGKTTLARILSRSLSMTLLDISAVESGAKELKAIVAKAKAVGSLLLFIDEIHRFNKLQQDILLPHVEKGTLVLVGSTTENPAFSVNKAIRSRCLIMHFQQLTRESIEKALKNVCASRNISVKEEFISRIAALSQGDMRQAFNMLEAVSVAGESAFSELEANPVYDRLSDAHYDHASALQKSIRGGDANAAVYWLGKMIAAGEDPEFIARRLFVCAAEDVGNAEPLATILASAALNAVQQLGFPEARIHLAQTAVFLARAPKSNETIRAIDIAMHRIQNGESFPVPPHLKDRHYPDAEKMTGGKNYIYTHDNPFENQLFLPKELQDAAFTGETELTFLPPDVEKELTGLLERHPEGKLNLQWMARQSGIPAWKLKKALRYFVKIRKLELNGDLTFRLNKENKNPQGD